MTTTPFKKLLLLSIWVLLGFTVTAQTYELQVTNEQQINSTTYQFDVYLLRTGGTPIELASVQFGLGYDISILNGGTPVFSYVAGSTQLQGNQATFPLQNGGLNYTVGTKTYRYLNQNISASNGVGNGTIISATRNGCLSVGTRIGTYRLTNSTEFAANSRMNHIFSTAAGSQKTNTRIFAYVGGLSTELTNTSSHYGYESANTCLLNIALNGCALVSSPSGTNATCGSANGTASANVTGNTGAVTYTISPAVNTTGATTGTFSELPAGSYTISYTSGSCSGTTTTIVVGTDPDTVTPSITQCAPTQSVSTGTGNVPDFTAFVTASDNCTQASNLVITQSPVAGSTLAAGTHQITITVTDEANNSSTCTTTLTVESGCNYTIDTAIVGPTNSCLYTASGPSATYSIAATSASGYSWSVTAAAGPTSYEIIGGSNNSTFEIHYNSNFTTGTISVTVTSECGGPDTRSITVTKAVPVLGLISGPVNACPYIGTGTQVTYSVPAIANALSYDWLLPANTTLVSGQGTNSIVMTYNTGFVASSIKVRAISGCATTAYKSLAISLKVPATPGVITGELNACPFIGSDSIAYYKIRVVPFTNSYIWTVPNGATIVSHPGGAGTATDTIIGVQFNSAFAAFDTIKVRAANTCGQSLLFKGLVVKRIAAGTPSTITGPVNACPIMVGADNPTGTPTTYSIRRVKYATSYIWTVPAGVTVLDHPGGAGINDTAIVVRFESTFTLGSIQVQSVTGCGTSLMKSLAVKRLLPATPGVITGPTDPCPSIGTTATYSIPVMPANSTSIVWTVTGSGATITGGQGTLSITVQYTTAVNTGDSVYVIAYNNCAQSAKKVLKLSKKLPATPGTISGPLDPCPYVGGSTTYSIAAMPLNATGVVWSVTGSGATIISGQGTLSIEVAFTGAVANGDSIKVRSFNNCTQSLVKAIKMAKKLPSTPGTITGPLDPCPTIGGVATYSLAALPTNATSVLWTAPAGASIVGSATGLSVDIAFTNAFTTGGVSVVGVNNCATSAPKTLAIVRKMPATPGTITAALTGACPNRTYTYSIAAMPLNANSVTWTVPAGGTILSGQGGLSISVSYDATAITGSVTATGVNNCGSGLSKALAVNLAACPVTPGAPLSKVTPTVVKPQVEILSMEAKVFPNPSTTSFKLQVNTTAKEQIQVRIVDVMGRAHKQLNMMPGEILNFGSDLRTGTYMVEIRQGANRTTQQIIKL